MLFGGVTSLLVMFAIMLIPHPSETMLTTLFFALGFFTSSQVIGYPTITESNPKELTGTSMGIAALIIMGMAGVIQPLSGQLLDLSWSGGMQNGAPLYALKDFMTAFMIFPIGFVIALIALIRIKEPQKAMSSAKA